MKKFLTLALVAALVLGASSMVYANVCAFDPVPAATLLFPFVVFDYNSPTAGATTLFAITNVSSEAQIVHVTLWSDDSVPVLDFNIVLSGYDLQSINIRDILYDGLLPVTGTSGALDIWGPLPAEDGPVSHSDGLWLDGILPYPEATSDIAARCPSTSSAYPGAYAGGLTSNDIDTLYIYFTATQDSTRLHTDCLGATYNLDIPDWWATRSLADPTWLYITADVVYECNRLFPSQAAYWALPPAGPLQYQNVLIGDVFWLDDLANFSEADNAVHLEADPEIAQVATLDALNRPITFYHRYTETLGAIDFREPLPTAWAFRFLGVDSTLIDTHIRAFKASTFFPTVIDLDYAGAYLALDCLAYTYWAWDEDEWVITVDESPYSIPGVINVFPNLLPLETQEVMADEFNTPASNGWFLFVWPNSNFDNILGAPALTPGVDHDWYQTWMGVKYSAFGKFSAFLSGAVMANFNCFSDQVLPTLGINYNYVGGGNYVSSPAYTGP